MKRAIRRKYCVDMPVRSVGEYLRRWRHTPRQPARRAYGRDEEEAKEWPENTCPGIKKREKGGDEAARRRRATRVDAAMRREAERRRRGGRRKRKRGYGISGSQQREVPTRKSVRIKLPARLFLEIASSERFLCSAAQSLLKNHLKGLEKNKEYGEFAYKRMQWNDW